MAITRSQEAQAEMSNMSALGAPVQVVNGRPTFSPAQGERNLKLQAKATRLAERMMKIGVRAATIISMRPFPINPQGEHSSNYPLPPCPVGEKFVKRVIPWYETSVINNEHGEQDVEEVLPIDIANDIQRQQNKSGYRGVIVYMGERDPLGPMDPRDHEMRNLAKELEAEEKAMTEEFRRYVQDANDAHNNGKGKSVITDKHRGAASWMLARKLLSKQPDWLLESRTVDEVPAPCPVCGAEPTTKQALQCVKCATWLKPFEAVKAGLISPADEGGRLALQRCTRKELEELGFYPHIKPYAEANADFLKSLKQQKQ